MHKVYFFLSYRYIFLSYRYISFFLSFLPVSFFLSFFPTSLFLSFFLSYRFLSFLLSFLPVSFFLSFLSVSFFLSFLPVSFFFSFFLTGVFLSFCLSYRLYFFLSFYPAQGAPAAVVLRYSDHADPRGLVTAQPVAAAGRLRARAGESNPWPPLLRRCGLGATFASRDRRLTPPPPSEPETPKP